VYLGILNQVLTATKLKKVPLFLAAQSKLLKSLFNVDYFDEIKRGLNL